MGADVDRRNVAVLSRARRERYPVTVLHENMRSDAINGINLVDLRERQRLEWKFVPIDDDLVLAELDCLTGQADYTLWSAGLKQDRLGIR